MLRRFGITALLLLALALTTGCSAKTKFFVESDTSWTGTINGAGTISGNGNATYKVVGKIDCIVVTKATVPGYVRVRIDGHPWYETSDPMGVVTACD